MSVENHTKSLSISAGLYIVSTPIGNMRDITLRAIDILQKVDFIACEDTRHSAPLLHHYDIHKPLFSYHDHNAATKRPILLEKLQQGARVALISDAGTPLIADPGYKLVTACYDAGIKVHSVAGCSAVTAALSIGGLPTDAFCFLGFLPAKTTARCNVLAKAADYPMTLVFYETPQRLLAALDDIEKVLGNRTIAVARELTKLYETVVRGSVQSVREILSKEPLKGEIVLLIAGAETKEYSEAEIITLLKDALVHLSLKEAVANVAAVTGAQKTTVYACAIALKNTR